MVTARHSLNWPAVDADLLAGLPPVLRAIVRALGFARAREWLTQRGGCALYYPVRRTLTLGLTAEEYERLNQTLAPHLDACRRVILPKPDKIFQFARNASIRAERATASINDLALRHRLTSRHIQNICQGWQDEPAQNSLF